MAIATCMKCSKEVEVQDPKIIQNGNRFRIAGKCACGTNVTRFLSKDTAEKLKGEGIPVEQAQPK